MYSPSRLHGVITLNVVTNHILRHGTRRFILVFQKVCHLTQLIQLKTVLSFAPYSSKISFCIILSSVSKNPKWYFRVRFPYNNAVYIFFISSCVLHAPSVTSSLIDDIR